jgi:hypothetical protein
MTKIPALAPRLRRFDEDFSKKPSHIQAPVVIPYMMHLVTLSPLAVIVTPDQFYQAGSCGGSPATGCIASSRTGAELFYQSVIQVVPGSFIFSTDAPTEFQTIPSDARHFEFQLPDSQLQLTAANGVWRIRRDERKWRKKWGAGVIP